MFYEWAALNLLVSKWLLWKTPNAIMIRRHNWSLRSNPEGESMNYEDYMKRVSKPGMQVALERQCMRRILLLYCKNSSRYLMTKKGALVFTCSTKSIGTYCGFILQNSKCCKKLQEPKAIVVSFQLTKTFWTTRKPAAGSEEENFHVYWDRSAIIMKHGVVVKNSLLCLLPNLQWKIENSNSQKLPCICPIRGCPVQGRSQTYDPYKWHRKAWDRN